MIKFKEVKGIREGEYFDGLHTIAKITKIPLKYLDSENHVKNVKQYINSIYGTNLHDDIVDSIKNHVDYINSMYPVQMLMYKRMITKDLVTRKLDAVRYKSKRRCAISKLNKKILNTVTIYNFPRKLTLHDLKDYTRYQKLLILRVIKSQSTYGIMYEGVGELREKINKS